MTAQIVFAVGCVLLVTGLATIAVARAAAKPFPRPPAPATPLDEDTVELRRVVAEDTAFREVRESWDLDPYQPPHEGGSR